MDWKLRFRNLRTGREVERVFDERNEFVSRARAVDEDIWSELLSATAGIGNRGKFRAKGESWRARGSFISQGRRPRTGQADLA